MDSKAGVVTLVFRGGAKHELGVTDVKGFCSETLRRLAMTKDGGIEVMVLIGPNGSPGQGTWIIVNELVAVLEDSP